METEATRARVLVAQILKPHGMQGEVRVRSLSDVAGRFRVGARFWVEGEPPMRVTVSAVRRDPSGGFYLRFREWGAIGDAARARGWYLAIEESQRPPLPEGCFYHDTLKGLEAWTEDGERVGIVRDIWPTGPHDVLVLEAGALERLLPAVKSVIVRVDLATGRIIVRPPNGWMDDATL